ncbi:hypothetical protein KKB55_15260 [Myxococcota bacterium]|nr:hypothetical protein [Myxococcota bacterium]MBU1899096.1 hypothetical protein [Myxococcota bacterium]
MYQARWAAWARLAQHLHALKLGQPIERDQVGALWPILLKHIIEDDTVDPKPDQIVPSRHRGFFIRVDDLPAPELVFPSPGHRGLVLPGLASMLGVFGTFLGIQWGLYFSGLDSTLSGQQSTDTEALVSGASMLFSSMGTAFLTSLLGMLFTAVMTWRIAVLYRFKNDCRRSLEDFFENYFVIWSREAVLLEHISEKLDMIPEIEIHLSEMKSNLGSINDMNNPQQQLIVNEIVSLTDEILEEKINGLLGRVH